MSNKDRAKIQPYAWVIFCLVAFFCAYEFAARVMIGPLTQVFLHTFKFSAKEVGFLTSAFFFGYAPVQLIAGFCFSKYGAKQVLSMALFLCSLTLGLFSFSHSFYSLFILRFFTGFAGGFAIIGAYIMIARWFPMKWWASLYGLIQLITCMGAVVGQNYFSEIATWRNWRSLTFDLSVIGSVFFILFILGIKNNHQPALVKQQHKSFITQLKIVLSEKQSFWIAAYAMFAWAPIEMFATLWGTMYLQKQFLQSTYLSTSLISATWIGVGLVSPLVGYFSGVFKNRKIFLLSCSLLGLLSTSMLLLYQGNNSNFLFGLLFLLGVSTSGQPISFVAIQRANDPSVAGMAISINNMAIIIGSGLLVTLSSFMTHLHHQAFSPQLLYTNMDLRWGLSLMPLCCLINMAISFLFIKEDNQVFKEKNYANIM